MKHSVTLVTPTETRVVECDEEEFILDAAAAQGLPLPAVCRGGACASCACKFVEGAEPDQSEQSYLSEDDVQAGWVLLCVAYPRGACTIETHKMAEYLATLGPDGGI